MLWMAGNVQARMDPAGNVKPDKSASKPATGKAVTKRIDGFVCLTMAVGIYLLREPPKKSVYEERGLLRF
jgi:phage terminase large subunit-like protein